VWLHQPVMLITVIGTASAHNATSKLACNYARNYTSLITSKLYTMSIEFTLKVLRCILFFIEHTYSQYSTSDYTFRTLYRSYFKGISANNELQVFSGNWCSPYMYSISDYYKEQNIYTVNFVFINKKRRLIAVFLRRKCY
jgi:hypothetical protein